MKNLLLTLALFLVSFTSFGIAPISGFPNMCVGSNYGFSDATPGGTWSCSDVAIGTISASGSSMFFTCLTAGVVTITYTVGGPYVTMTATVNPLPAPISGSTSFCNYNYSNTYTNLSPGGAWSCGEAAFDSINTAGVLYHLPGCAGGCGTDVITYTLPTGCARTLTVTVNPIVVVYIPPNLCVTTIASAIGTPGGGTWSTSMPAIATINPTSGSIMGVTPGTAVFTYTLSGCILSNWGSPTLVSAGINDHHVNNVSDTTCSGPDFYISACDATPSYNVTTRFGDGSSSSTPFGSYPFAHVFHNYASPGTYSVKQTVYNGTIPVDSASFSYEYLYCHTLPIKLYIDKNHNCVKDANEHFSFLPITIRVDSNGVPVDTISATSGLYYKASGLPGTIYSFRVLSTPAGITSPCPMGGVIYDTIYSTVNTYVTKYFGLDCVSGTLDFDLAQNTGMQTGRHAAEGQFQITNSFGTIVNPEAVMNISPKFIYQSAIPIPTSIVGNTVKWNFDSVCMTTIPSHIKITLNRPGAWLIPGDTVHTTLFTTPVGGDVNTGNNYIERVDTVKSSWDPNMISVSPSWLISAGTMLEYTVMFENDGNDTADNIHVMDTVSDYLDMSTLRMISATHNMNIAVMKQGGFNIVKFDFPNIKLLDSSHHNMCQGMFKFNIKAKDGIADGIIIPNRVGIFFDDNEVVMTNTAQNIIGTTPSLSASELGKALHVELYPNPATDILTIKTENGAYTSFAISNSVGQILVQQPVNTTQMKVDVKMLTPGLYYVALKGLNGTTVKKFVKN